MTPFQRNLAVFGTLAIALAVLGAMTYPAYTDSDREHNELNAKRKEFQAISLKVNERDRLDSLKRGLEGDINSLRNAVPKAPYVDLLMLDLERMASESNVQILAMELPAKENGKDSSDGDLEDLTAKDKEGKPMVKPAFLHPGTTGSGISTTSSGTGGKPGEAPNPLGLKQVSKRLFISGDYQNLIAFVKHLETYQRVISLKDLSVAIASGIDSAATKTAAGERAQKLKLDRPVMSFLLNVYYLP